VSSGTLQTALICNYWNFTFCIILYIILGIKLLCTYQLSCINLQNSFQARTAKSVKWLV